MTLQPVLRPILGAPVVTAVELAALTSPSDGEEVYLRAESSPQTLWHLRWNAGSSEPYQWEFLGGPPMFTMLDSEIALDNTPHDAWRAGDSLPQLFVPRPGVYHIRYGAYIGAPADGVASKIGIGLDGSDPATINSAIQYNTRDASVTSENDMELSGTLRARMAYFRGDSAGNDMQVGRRWISIIPLRVS